MKKDQYVSEQGTFSLAVMVVTEGDTTVLYFILIGILTVVVVSEDKYNSIW